MVPDSDTAARDGIGYLKMIERFAEYQLQAGFPQRFMPFPASNKEISDETDIPVIRYRYCCHIGL